jgi:hypothetical protein
VAAQVQQHPVGPVVRDLKLGGERPGAVTPVDHVLLDQRSHAGEWQLLIALDQGRLAADLGQDPLEGAVVQGQHVVAGGLDQEQPLQPGQSLRLLHGQVAGLGPVAGAVVEAVAHADAFHRPLGDAVHLGRLG